MKGKKLTPQKVSSILQSALTLRGLNIGEPFTEVTTRKGHRVQEHVFRLRQPGAKPILVIVRIDDVRLSHRLPSVQAPTGEPGANSFSFHFDSSGLPLLDE